MISWASALAFALACASALALERGEADFALACRASSALSALSAAALAAEVAAEAAALPAPSASARPSSRHASSVASKKACCRSAQCCDADSEAPVPQWPHPSHVVMQYWSWCASSSAERVCGVAEASCHGSSDQCMKRIRELLGKAPDLGRAPPKRQLKSWFAREPA